LGLVVIVWLNAGSPEIDSPTAADGDFVGTALQAVAGTRMLALHFCIVML
jgi:hypothetical protein